MLVGWTEEQVQLGQATKALLGRIASEPEVRRLMATPNGFEPATWSALRPSTSTIRSATSA